MLLRVLLGEGERVGSRPGRQQNQEDHLDGDQADDQAGRLFSNRHFSIKKFSLPGGSEAENKELLQKNERQHNHPTRYG